METGFVSGAGASWCLTKEDVSKVLARLTPNVVYVYDDAVVMVLIGDADMHLDVRAALLRQKPDRLFENRRGRYSVFMAYPPRAVIDQVCDLALAVEEWTTGFIPKKREKIGKAGLPAFQGFHRW